MTDDSDSINAAINAAARAGGGTVYLPAGTYMIYQAHTVNPDLGGCIVLKNGVRLAGESQAGTVLYNTHANDATVSASQQSNISVSNLTLDGNSTGQDGTKFYACTNVTVDHVTARNTYIGIALYDCIDSTVSNCYVHNISDTGIALSAAYLYYQLGTRVAAIDCEASACGLAGFRAGGRNLLSGNPLRLNGVTFTRCYSHGNSTGFSVTYASNLTMTDCTAANNPTNIFLGGVQTAHLHNCPPAYILTDTSSQSWARYGPCSGIVQN